MMNHPNKFLDIVFHDDIGVGDDLALTTFDIM